jgi:mannose-6-phosphate isomerase-like protein (cupin superfamily)
MPDTPDVIRFDHLKERGIPLMFIDSALPGHHRMNFALIGDTASENPAYAPAVTSPHDFQLGMAMCPPGQGPGYHTHDYIEAFFVLRSTFRFHYGHDENEPSDFVDVGPWDLITLPPQLWRSFENVGDEDGWFFAVLESHEAFDGKDPYWSPTIQRAAAEAGFEADARGKMIPPDDFAEREAEARARLAPHVARTNPRE